MVVIHIHRANGLKKMDSRNSSGQYCLGARPRRFPVLLFHVRAHSIDLASADPYVIVVYSRQGKPLYSTVRVDSCTLDEV